MVKARVSEAKIVMSDDLVLDLAAVLLEMDGRGLHSSTFQLNLSRFCH
jgi:hypothetical protein